jgi:predicted nucleic acid-binding protein
MISKVFLDTNIIVDYAVGNRPKHEQASLILELCSSRSIIIGATPASLCTLCYLLEREKWPHKEVKNWLNAFSDLIEIVNTSKEDIQSAAASTIADTEDAIMLFSAVSSGYDFFITSNERDFPRKQKGITIVTPHEFIDKVRDSST